MTGCMMLNQLRGMQPMPNNQLGAVA